MYSSSKNTFEKKGNPSKVWWLIGVILLALCIVIQMPAVWLINQFMPNSPYIQHVSGNIWQGSAVATLPIPSAQPNTMPLSGTLTWQMKPMSLFLGKLSAEIDFKSGKTQLDGRVGRGFSTWEVTDLSGKIDKQTLASVVNWQLPEAPIQVNTLSAKRHKEKGFSDVEGQLTWSGGELDYPNGNKVYKIILPAMRADITQEARSETNVIHANLVDNNSKRLGDIYLDAQGMIDVSLTQRLLENMPSYKGSAPADTAVVSVRQPLLGSMANGGGS